MNNQSAKKPLVVSVMSHDPPAQESYFLPGSLAPDCLVLGSGYNASGCHSNGGLWFLTGGIWDMKLKKKQRKLKLTSLNLAYPISKESMDEYLLQGEAVLSTS